MCPTDQNPSSPLLADGAAARVSFRLKGKLEALWARQQGFQPVSAEKLIANSVSTDLAIPPSRDEFFSARLRAMCNSDASEAQLEREVALASCIKWLDESDLTADDLYFIAVLISRFWSAHPAALFERLRSVGDETPQDAR